METTPPPLPTLSPRIARRNATTINLITIAVLLLLLQVPLYFVGSMQAERRANIASGRSAWAEPAPQAEVRGGSDTGVSASSPRAEATLDAVFEPYRMVERALKYNVLVLVLVFAAFFLFETMCDLRLHAVHYGLVGAAMALFYLALLALGEVIAPGLAYAAAAVASSLLITLYALSILRSRERAVVIGLLLACVHGILYVVLRMESLALLAGTATLFVALAVVMYFTRNLDWHGKDAGKEVVA